MTTKEKKNYMKHYNDEVRYYIDLCKTHELSSKVVLRQGEKITDLRRIITQVFDLRCTMNDSGLMINIG